MTFRDTRAGAVSYFVGDDPSFADPGFAIGTPGAKRSPWVKCEPELFHSWRRDQVKAVQWSGIVAQAPV